MAKNQLFRILPDIEIVTKILQTFGLSSLEDTTSITKETIQNNNTIEQLNDIKETLETYYLPCKTMYIRDITEKRCIVILRQFIKVHGYTLFSRERHIKGKKVNIYRIIKDDKKPLPGKNKKITPIVISFK
jgi:hypothetical protein